MMLIFPLHGIRYVIRCTKSHHARQNSFSLTHFSLLNAYMQAQHTDHSRTSKTANFTEGSNSNEPGQLTAAAFDERSVIIEETSVIACTVAAACYFHDHPNVLPRFGERHFTTPVVTSHAPSPGWLRLPSRVRTRLAG